MAAMVHNKARDLATYSQPYGQGAGTTGKQTNVSGDLRFYEPEVQSTYPMVQNKARDSAPYSRPYWQGERTTAEQADPPDELRYHEPEVRSTYPITIGELLRRHCHVKAKKYFVAVINDEGKMEYYAGPNQIAHPERLFNVEGFLRSQARDGSVTSSSQGDENPFEKDKHRLGQIEYWGSHRPLQDRRHNQGYEDYNSPYRTTKKPRKTVPRRNSDEPGQTMVQTSKKGLRIGDLGALWSFYDQRFKDCQQTACRLIAKAWVKALEPRKQSTHPYIGSVAPDWWPKSWGTGPDNKVRHKEPDHLYKKERIHLLIHILRLVVEPNNNQHSAIRYLNLNIGKLEEVTMECLNSFFADKENPKNSQKKLYLKEIFKVAKFEERYKNGEIDSEFELFVMADDMMPENYQSDKEENTWDDKEENTWDDQALPELCHRSASGPSSLGRFGGFYEDYDPVQGRETLVEQMRPAKSNLGLSLEMESAPIPRIFGGLPELDERWRHRQTIFSGLAPSFPNSLAIGDDIMENMQKSPGATAELRVDCKPVGPNDGPNATGKFPIFGETTIWENPPAKDEIHVSSEYQSEPVSRRSVTSQRFGQGEQPHTQDIDSMDMSTTGTTPPESASDDLDVDILSISGNSEGSLLHNSSEGFQILLRVIRRIILEFQAEADNEATIEGGSTNPQTLGPSRPSGNSVSRKPSLRNKRKQGDDAGEGDRENDPPKRKRSNSQPGDCPQRPKFLACPFWKLDPVKHWSCFLKRIDTIGHLKQHLSRRHTPTLYCQRCFIIFENQSAYSRHMEMPCVWDGSSCLDGITTNQSRALSRRSRGSEEKLWRNMWQIIFPGHLEPDSIYVDADRSEDFCLMKEFSRREGLNILREELQSSGRVLRSDISAAELDAALRQAMGAMFESFRPDRSTDSISSRSARSGSRTTEGRFAQQDSTAESRAASGIVLQSLVSPGTNNATPSIQSSRTQLAHSTCAAEDLVDLQPPAPRILDRSRETPVTSREIGNYSSTLSQDCEASREHADHIAVDSSQFFSSTHSDGHHVYHATQMHRYPGNPAKESGGFQENIFDIDGGTYNEILQGFSDGVTGVFDYDTWIDSVSVKDT